MKLIRFSPLALLFVVALPACEGCGEPPVGEPEPTPGEPEPDGVVVCTTDLDCTAGQLCAGGVCSNELPTPGPNVNEPDAEPDAEPGVDAGPGPAAALTVLPDLFVEFGAQLIGVPVERDVTLVNTGDADLSLLAIILDDTSGEFSADPSGTFTEILTPGDSLVVTVAHTPQDGTPDDAELKVLHDGPGNLTTITLFAEFKGDAELNAHTDPLTMDPSTEAVAFGELLPGTPVTTTVWLRNTGRSDSVLSVTELTLTPAGGDFSLEGIEDLELPLLLPSWSSGLCPDDDAAACPPAAAGCLDGVCVDENDDPLHAFGLDVAYLPAAQLAQATLTIEHDAGGEGQQHDIILTGAPTQPEIEISPSTIEFGNVLVGADPAEVTIAIGNIGEGPLHLTRVLDPTDSRFEVEWDAPVPTLDGHPPVIIAPGGQPLMGTVRFLPDDAGGFADFINLETNDGASPAVPVPVSGAGVVCQKDAFVNAAGECECSPGFNACGDECLADGPESCGASCTDCTLAGGGPGTVATCQLGSCAYECAETWYDLDNDVTLDPATPGWDGCEYLCPRQVPFDDEICNGIDDTCDGVIDEGMPPDTAEPNEGCTLAVPPIGGSMIVDAAPNGSTTNFTGSIYPDGDVDWYTIRALEANSDFCVIDDQANLSIPCLDSSACESYRTEFRLQNLPPGANYALEVFMEPSPIDAGDTCLPPQQLPHTTGDPTVVIHEWTRCGDPLSCGLCFFFDFCNRDGYGCGFEDGQNYRVQVRSLDGSASCQDYTLEVFATSDH